MGVPNPPVHPAAAALSPDCSIYMMKVIVPQVILTAIAFSTFWVSACLAARLPPGNTQCVQPKP